MTIGSKLFFYKSLPSTNSQAAFLLKNDNIPEGSIIYTDYQSAGKGQMGNTWESENGKNLLFSIILYPTFIKPERQFIISMALALGICDFLDRYIPSGSIKWPNDIYLNNDKIAGMLIENSIMTETIESSVAGIGLNINQQSFSGNVPNAVSLAQLTGVKYDLGSCLHLLAADLDKRYNQLLSGNSSLIKNEYTSRLYRLNEWSQYQDHSGRFTGRILSVSVEGWLMIENKSGRVTGYSFKEVGFIP